LAALSESTRELVSVAAVAGHSFRLDVIERAAGAEPIAALDGIEEAMRAGLIYEVEGPSTFSFTHGLMRDAVYGEMSGARRSRLHASVAAAQLALDEPGDADLAFLAHHFNRAGDVAQTVVFARRAGDRAMAQLAYDEAAEQYLLGVEATRQSDDEDLAAQRLELRYRAALALVRAGSTDEAGALLDELKQESAVHGDVTIALLEDIASLEARLAKDRALAATGATRREHASKAAHRYEQIFDDVKRPYSCINAATMWLIAGDEVRARTLATTALELVASDDTGSSDRYWLDATEAEAALILDDTAAASAALARAVRHTGADLASRVTTHRQLTTILELKGIAIDVLTPLAVPANLKPSV
jgi:predicted ATPase